jgi:radical SAM superfamily enzyme YgiQ (UPF0313 family)
MKITFVNIRIDIYPPIGFCYLSAYLKKHFHDVEISLLELIMGDDKTNAIQHLLVTKPDIIGFTTYTVGFHDIQEFCRLLKQAAPELPIWLGGPHITSLPHTLPIEADAGIIGEGEETVAELYKVYRDNKTVTRDLLARIPGICYHTQTKEISVTPPRTYIASLDTIPPPDLSILNMKWYTARKHFMMMKGNFRGFILLTSRGCPCNCRFCQARVQWGKCRYHSAERVVEELENLRRSYPFLDAINIIDDLFIGDRKRLREIVRMILEKGLQKGISINVNGHVGMISEETLELLKSINVVQIAYGFESGSERVLKFLKRGSATLAQNLRAATLTNQYGIGVGGQFMIGCIDESEDEIEETIAFIVNNRMSHVNVSATTPLPGTELWNICKERGLVSEDMDWRRLDFGNIHNQDLLYTNQHMIPRERFRELLKKAQQACDKWNPVYSITGNLAYIYILPPQEFFRRAIRKMWKMICRILNKLRYNL